MKIVHFVKVVYKRSYYNNVKQLYSKYSREIDVNYTTANFSNFFF